MHHGIFDVESPFWLFMNKMADLLMLGLLWIFFCVPIITIGASTCGFFYTAMRLHEGRETGIFKDFWHAFCKNFGIATLTWLMQALVTAVLLFDIYACWQMSGTLGWCLLVMNGVLLVLLNMVVMFVYPVMARFSFPAKKMYHDAAVIAVTHLPHSLAVLLLEAAAAAAILYWPISFLFAPTIALYQLSRISVWIFNGYQKYEETGEIAPTGSFGRLCARLRRDGKKDATQQKERT